MDLNTTPMLLAVNKLRPALEHSWFALTDENPLLVRLAETDFKRSAFFFAISLVIWSAAGMSVASIRADSAENFAEFGADPAVKLTRPL